VLKTIRNYFSEKLTPSVRYLHYSILFLVLLQIILSNFIEINDDGAIGQNAIEYYSTWAHISVGLSLLLLAIVFTVVEFSKHGFSYFYPYLSGDLSQLKSDLSKLKSLEVPDASPKGLAAVIQGLGLGAILLVALSGTTWFVLWLYDLALANDVKEIHQLLTGLIEAYIIGHGGMGLMHIFIAFKEQKAANK
jgi:cytochrome b561